MFLWNLAKLSILDESEDSLNALHFNNFFLETKKFLNTAFHFLKLLNGVFF